MCGHEWRARARPDWWALSNTYAAVSKCCGIVTPNYYPYGKEVTETFKSIIEELTATLPVVMARVTLDDLETVEHQRSGAARVATGVFGANYLDHVEISEF